MSNWRAKNDCLFAQTSLFAVRTDIIEPTNISDTGVGLILAFQF